MPVERRTVQHKGGGRQTDRQTDRQRDTVEQRQQAGDNPLTPSSVLFVLRRSVAPLPPFDTGPTDPHRPVVMVIRVYIKLALLGPKLEPCAVFTGPKH